MNINRLTTFLLSTAGTAAIFTGAIEFGALVPMSHSPPQIVVLIELLLAAVVTGFGAMVVAIICVGRAIVKSIDDARAAVIVANTFVRALEPWTQSTGAAPAE
jgi:hypothetical protein